MTLTQAATEAMMQLPPLHVGDQVEIIDETQEPIYFCPQFVARVWA